MKKFLIWLSVLIIVLVSGYLYLRYDVLKTKDFKPDTSKKESVVDLRPAIIAKLQQMVKDGSDGLYVLSIEKLSPDVLASEVEVINASLDIDSSVLLKLDGVKQLPDDLFRIRFHALHITGLGIDDFLNKKRLSLAHIDIDSPLIEAYHRTRSYNSSDNDGKDSMTMYQRLAKGLRKIIVDKINVRHGIFINHNLDHKNNVTRINNISVKMEDILIDSTSQFDKSRYLFAKHTLLRAENYSVLTANRDYLFSVGPIEASGEEHTMTVQNVELQPHGGRQALRNKLPYRKVIYHLKIPKLEIKGVHWWSILNRNKYKAKEATIYNSSISAYNDNSLPPPPVVKQNNFPQQLLMQIPVPVSVGKFHMHNFKIIYEEYNPKVKITSNATIDHIEASMDHISNIKTEIDSHHVATFTANGLFMGLVPTRGTIRFDLAKARIGAFSADFAMETLNKETVNPISEPMALFTIKRGQMQKGSTHFEANNSESRGSISMYYSDLHVTPLKADSNENGKLKSKSLKSFIANKFIIKDDNPGRDGLREPTFLVHRDTHAGFFKLIWESIMSGMIKSIGLPVKLFYKNAE
jgi:hypothetical protein